MNRVHEPQGLAVLELVPDVPVEVGRVCSREATGGRCERTRLDQIGHRRVHGSIPRTVHAYRAAGSETEPSFVKSLAFVNRPFLLFQCMFG